MGTDGAPGNVAVAARVAGVSTAVPEHELTQAESRAFARSFFSRDFADLDRLLDAFDHAGIERRQLVRPIEWYGAPRSFPEKNEVYRVEALALAEQAALQAIAASGLSPADLGALLFVSTTGVSTPSLDSLLIPRLGLRRSVARLPIWGLGCAGGAAGLGHAAALATALGQPVLLIAVEICSTTFVHGDRSKSNLIATALFGDGAAAAIVTPGGTGAEILGRHSHLVDDSQDVMGWTVADEGLRVVFARSIPNLVQSLAAGVVDDAASAAGIARSDMAHFIFHPGGAKVLAAYRDTFGLSEHQLRHAAGVLRDHGNMSSPSVLFVLERFFAEEPATGRPACLMALGPGFSAECVVLRW